MNKFVAVAQYYLRKQYNSMIELHQALTLMQSPWFWSYLDNALKQHAYVYFVHVFSPKFGQTLSQDIKNEIYESFYKAKAFDGRRFQFGTFTRGKIDQYARFIQMDIQKFIYQLQKEYIYTDMKTCKEDSSTYSKFLEKNERFNPINTLNTSKLNTKLNTSKTQRIRIYTKEHKSFIVYNNEEEDE
ncbi:Hypothetical_protein [Hexamita inflata]|uniref:Hypothetical_protein n=1 Tax=Hexamita inflata TaxID=28002 RepID=A0AA86PCG1_9EUKA|nr:Hypothetical protein HINF_LOCUS22523 [Hexamita inflata]